MLRAAFGESVRQEIRIVPGEGFGDGVRIEHVGMQRVVGLVRLFHMYEAAESFWPQMAVHEPFHEPNSFQRPLRDFRDEVFR